MFFLLLYSVPRQSRSQEATTVAPAASREWAPPRWRAEAATHPRAATEAGPRRTPGRWDPLHG